MFTDFFVKILHFYIIDWTAKFHLFYHQSCYPENKNICDQHTYMYACPNYWIIKKNNLTLL